MNVTGDKKCTLPICKRRVMTNLATGKDGESPGEKRQRDIREKKH